MLLSVNGTAQSYGLIPERTDLRDHPVKAYVRIKQIAETAAAKQQKK
jgi:hypothetical protein